MNRRIFLTHSIAGMTLAVGSWSTRTRLAASPWPEDLGRLEFYRPPQLTVMTGFIKDPQHQHYTVREWSRGIGRHFDAPRLVDRFLEAGIREVIWYDKWIDGLVFRPTATTAYHTEHNFLRDWMDAIEGTELKMVPYFNTFYDDNPEFSDWACRDVRGKPITFSPFWPQKLLSPYSPFREKALEQIRELFEDYDVDGIWLDVPFHPSISYDSWTQNAFREQFGQDLEEATPNERRRFSLDSAADWNREVVEYVRSLKPSAVVTTNGFFHPLQGPRAAASMGEPLDYYSVELHTVDRQEEMAPTLQEYEKPVETGTLLSDDWFTPLWQGPMRTSKSPNELRLELARLLGRGLNLWMAVTLAHDGSVDSGTLALVDEAGSWLKERRRYLEESRSYAPVGIALGRGEPEDLNWPGGRGVMGTSWGLSGDDYHSTLAELRSRLADSGHLARLLVNCPNVQKWSEIPEETEWLVVPDRVALTTADAERIEEFVRKGGRLLAFGRGGGLEISGESPSHLHPLFGARTAGYLLPGRRTGFQATAGEEVIALESVPIQVTVESAEVLWWMESSVEGNLPLLTESRIGSGRAYFCSIPEEEFLRSPSLLDHLRNLIFPEPLWSFDKHPERYKANLRRLENSWILQILDSLSVSEGPMGRYRPTFETISLNRGVLDFERALLLPERQTLAMEVSGAWTRIEVYPNPELMIVLEG